MADALTGRDLDIATAKALGWTARQEPERPIWQAYDAAGVGRYPLGHTEAAAWGAVPLYSASGDGLLTLLMWASAHSRLPWVSEPGDGIGRRWQAQCLDADGNRHYGEGAEPGTALARALVAAHASKQAPSAAAEGGGE